MLKVDGNTIEEQFCYEWGYLSDCKNRRKKVIDFRIKFTDKNNHNIEFYIETSIGCIDLQNMIANKEEKISSNNITDLLYFVDEKCAMFNYDFKFSLESDLIIKITRITDNFFKIGIVIKHYNVEFDKIINIKFD